MLYLYDIENTWLYYRERKSKKNLKGGNMKTDLGNIESRHFAGALDEPIDDPTGKNEKWGCNPSSEAIGGYYGIAWYEFFRDVETREIYKVRCSDGVNGGKGAHSNEDEDWRQQCYEAIVARTHREARARARAIRISRNEWNIMKSRTHARWLESAERKTDGKQADRTIQEGLIGHCWGTPGIPVIVDPNKEDNLPPRQ